MLVSNARRPLSSLSAWAFVLVFAACCSVTAQTIRTSASHILGIRFQPGITAVVDEIEKKTGKSIYAEYRELDDYQLGVSFIADEDGRAVVLVDPLIERDRKKVEAVVVHELLHLRLRVRGYPSYLFSPAVNTARGRAIDVEQGTINDLRSLIEHEVFRADMEAFGLGEQVDLAGDTLAAAEARRGQRDSQVDTVNYARAVLEYLNTSDAAALKKAYQANRWKRSLADGEAIAALIRRSPMTTPAAAEAVFLSCIAKLYPPPARNIRFTLTNDPKNKYFRQLIINLKRR